MGSFALDVAGCTMLMSLLSLKLQQQLATALHDALARAPRGLGRTDLESARAPGA
jgi:hypothetical protein